jgi:hypothetical protein
VIEARTLAAPPGLRHGFFTREGGESEGIYTSLNCGAGSDDDPDRVTANRMRVLARLDLPRATLCTVWQEHGTTVRTVTEPCQAQADRPADALVTATPGLALGILTADCAPVLIADPDHAVVGAVHCGWKGALAGIAVEAVAAMVRLGAQTESLVAAIGPCIAAASYEVGSDFHDRFVAVDPGSNELFGSGAAGRPHFDLEGYVARRFRDAGVARIEVLNADTYADEARFFSYRRAYHRDEPDYGRQISVIALAP